jgi:mannosylglycerate hydrolase
VLRDADGSEVPYEIVNQDTGYGIAYTRYGYPAQSRVERFEVRVLLASLPALGLRDLQVVRTGTFPVYESPASLQTEEQAIENTFLRVEAKADGSFYVTDKQTGYTYGPLGYFEDGADAGDAYNYSPPPEDQLLDSREAEYISVAVVPGIYRIGLQVSGTWSLPAGLTEDLKHRSSETRLLSFSTEASLDLFSRAVTFETTIDNEACDHRLRVLFETGRQTNQHHADNAFAILSREQQHYDPSDFAIEVPAAVAPMHRFVTVEDEEAGATILADGLPEYELKYNSGGVLALTLLRCVGELGRDGLMMRPGGQGGWRNATPEAQCLGQHPFRYAFLPHPAGWEQQVGLIQESAETFLLPVQAQPGKTDSIQADRSFLQIEPSVLVLSAFKEAAQGDGLILRVYNPTPRTIEGKIWFADIPTEVQRVNLEEKPGIPQILQEHDLYDTWAPFSIHTYRLHNAATR